MKAAELHIEKKRPFSGLFILVFLLTSCQGLHDSNSARAAVHSTSAERNVSGVIYDTVWVPPPAFDTLSISADTDEGISDVVRCVFQDSKHKLWFGAQGGAYCYDDGALIKINGVSDENGRAVTIKEIAEDINGHIWFAHTDGISRFDGQSVKNYFEHDGLASYDVWCITPDRSGNVWVGTREGVSVFNNGVFEKFELPKGKRNPDLGVSSAAMIHDIMEDSKGRIWFSTNGGVMIYDGVQIDSITVSDGLPTNFVDKVIEDRRGTYCISTGKGLFRWDGGVLTNMVAGVIADGQGTGAIMEDSDGRIWFGSNRRDIYYSDGDTFLQMKVSQSSQGPIPFQIYEDHQSRMWFVGFGGAFRLVDGALVKVNRNGPW